VPSNTAVQERSQYGTVRHTVKAWCEGAGSWGTISAFPRPVWFVGSPCPAGELPSGECSPSLPSHFHRRGTDLPSNSAEAACMQGKET
jgi:hypothetical protein